jgi:copper chaperone CopZ
MRTTLALGLVLLLSACGASDDGAGTNDSSAGASDSGAPVAEAPATWRGDGNLLEFSADGMGCSGCEATIQKRIGELEGVTAVEADKDTRVVKVTLEDGVDREALEAQITKVLETPESGKAYTIVRP